jgi:hypothetical protein
LTENYRRQLPLHPLLGRHVNHDPRSRAYAVQPTATTLVATRHTAYIDVLDQGQLGSCTGNAGVGAVYREPFVLSHSTPSTPWPYVADETGAVALYSEATKLDSYPGAYPPDDTGSDGLSVAKALQKAGIISGYLHAFTLQSALLQLMTTPLITGITWYSSMFEPGSTGELTVDTNSGVAGGHELCVDEYQPAIGTGPALIGGPNSWGTGWGDGGRWYMTVEDWGRLLADDGDVTAFVPATQPAPTPTPTPAPSDDADATLWTATKHWAVDEKHTLDNKKAATAVKAWAKAKGLQ